MTGEFDKSDNRYLQFNHSTRYFHQLFYCFIVFNVLLFRVDMFVHQTWKESRLKLPNDIFEEGDDYVTLPPEFFDNLWQPDPYFLNSKIAGNYRLLSLFISMANYHNVIKIQINVGEN